MSRVAAFRRWKLACTVVHAIARLREPIRRHARSKANWRKAIKVASATTLFQRMGAKRQDDRIAELLESLPECSVFDEGYFDEDGKWHYFDEFADEEGSNAGDGYEEVTIKRKKMFPTGAKGAKQDGDGEARGARRNERHPPGWQGEGKDLAVAPRTKRDLERLKAKFEISQRARIRCVFVRPCKEFNGQHRQKQCLYYFYFLPYFCLPYDMRATFLLLALVVCVCT